MKKSDLNMNKKAAMTAITKAKQEFNKHYHNVVPRRDYIVVINFREPSYRKRLYVYSLAKNEIVRAHHCAHGVRSSSIRNRAYANKFGNRVGSRMSSLGAMKTGRIYYGAYGKSLKLHGLEKGKNHNVFKRFVVMHPSKYVSDPYIMRKGRCGQSWGCPAVDYAISSSLISMIKDGVFLYAYY